MMAIDIAWGNDERTVLRWHFPSVWTWDEFDRAARQSSTLLHSVTHPVDVVMLTGGGNFPDGNAFAHLARSLNQRYQHFNRIVVVGTEGFESKLVTILVKLYSMWSNKIQQVNTVEEACAVLRHNSQAKLL
jgi:hypothetical protein